MRPFGRTSTLPSSRIWGWGLLLSLGTLHTSPMGVFASLTAWSGLVWWLPGCMKTEQLWHNMQWKLRKQFSRISCIYSFSKDELLFYGNFYGRVNKTIIPSFERNSQFSYLHHLSVIQATDQTFDKQVQADT